jgi:hypothetical protein
MCFSALRSILEQIRYNVRTDLAGPCSSLREPAASCPNAATWQFLGRAFNDGFVLKFHHSLDHATLSTEPMPAAFLHARLGEPEPTFRIPSALSFLYEGLIDPDLRLNVTDKAAGSDDAEQDSSAFAPRAWAQMFVLFQCCSKSSRGTSSPALSSCSSESGPYQMPQFQGGM